ncbi:MAG: hypothetical protein ACR2Q3_02320 [Woeseiaceae bacterium]
MSKQFIQMTSGWIPIAVMVLLAAALIAGQARANLPYEHRSAPVPAAVPVKIVLNTEMLKRLDALPAVVDSLLAMPINIELRIDTRILRGDLSQANVAPLKSK